MNSIEIPILWTFFQTDDDKDWHIVHVQRTTEEAREFLIEFVQSGFKFSIDKRDVAFLDLPSDIVLCGAILTEPAMPIRHEKNGTASPIVWLLSEQNDDQFEPGRINEVWESHQLE